MINVYWLQKKIKNSNIKRDLDTKSIKNPIGGFSSL